MRKQFVRIQWNEFFQSWSILFLHNTFIGGHLRRRNHLLKITWFRWCKNSLMSVLSSALASKGIFLKYLGIYGNFRALLYHEIYLHIFVARTNMNTYFDSIFHEQSNEILISFIGLMVMAQRPVKVRRSKVFFHSLQFFASTYPQNFYAFSCRIGTEQYNGILRILFLFLLIFTLCYLYDYY